MPTLEALKRRIDTARDLESVARTMKALSASSIRQYESAVIALADHYRTVELGLYVVLRNYPLPRIHPTKRIDKPLGAIVIGSDQGLCGRFNEVIADHAMTRMGERRKLQAERLVLAVGARVHAKLESLGQPVEDLFPVPGSVHGISSTVEELLLRLDAWRSEHGVDDVLLSYNTPAPGALYRSHTTQLLPMPLALLREAEARRWPTRVLPTFTMEPHALLSALLRQYIFMSLFRACAESLASEHASRLAAMQRASKNIEEHLLELNGQFQRQRQTSITEELLDIIAGYEALTGA